MKKKIDLSRLALALLMTLSVFASGCKKTNEDTDGLGDISGTTVITPAATTAPPETTAATTTTTAEITTTTTAPETETETETETVTEAETEASADENAKWTETEISGVMYVTQSCWSRKRAIVGSEAVDPYQPGMEVNVVAVTDTEYYKLADGSFIHSDYLSEEKPEVTAAPVTTTAPKPTTTKPKTTTAANDDEEIIDDDENIFVFPDDDEPVPPVTSSSSNTGSLINISYNKSYTNKYAYKTLSADEKKLYGDIVDAAMSLRSRVSVPSSLVSDDIFKVYGLVFNQEPQLFWLSRSVPTGYDSIRLSYEYDLDTILYMQSEIDSNVKKIMSEANKYSQTASKLKVFYDWIVLNNEFSKSESAATCGIYNGLTPGGKLQCAGYAKSMLYLCDMAGIDCMMIAGTNSEGLSHAWNKVYCDDGWYNLDTTWGDPDNAAIGYNWPDFIRYNFFLVPDEWIKNSHINVNRFTRSNGNTIKYFDPPSCTKSTYNYFRMYNKEFSDLGEAADGLCKEIKAAVKEKKHVAHIRVTSKSIWNKLTSSKEYLKIFLKCAQDSGAKSLTVARTKDNDGVMVVQYDILY